MEEFLFQAWQKELMIRTMELFSLVSYDERGKPLIVQ